MTNLFIKLAEKQLEGSDIQLSEKVNPILGAIGSASLLATSANMAQVQNNQNQPNHELRVKNPHRNSMGKIVKAEVDTKKYTITYIDIYGNKLVKHGGDISKLANNPGNIALPKKGFGPNNKQKFINMGAIGYYPGKTNVYAIFPTEEAGLKALKKWFNEPGRQNWNVRKAMHIYAPTIENNTENYIKFITRFGIKETDTLNDLSSSQKQKLISAIVQMEGKSKPSEELFIPNDYIALNNSNNTQKVSVNESKLPM